MAETKKKVAPVVEPQEEKDPRYMTPEEAEAYWNEMVPFKAFKDAGKYKDDITISVNGHVWVIQRGRTVMIPRYVAEVYWTSEAQDSATADLIERETTRYAEESKKYE